MYKLLLLLHVVREIMIMLEEALDANSCSRWHVNLDRDGCQSLDLLAQFKGFTVNVCNDVRDISYEKHIDKDSKVHPNYCESVFFTMLDDDVTEAYSGDGLDGPIYRDHVLPHRRLIPQIHLINPRVKLLLHIS